MRNTPGKLKLANPARPICMNPRRGIGPAHCLRKLEVLESDIRA
jgi:hypothetical protein